MATSRKSVGLRSQAVRQPISEVAERKAGRMLMDNRAHQKKVESAVRGKPMATKVPGKMGPSGRGGDSGGGNRRKDDKQTRTKKLSTHFQKILSGKAGKMQGKK